jgi:hypothetical protein
LREEFIYLAVIMDVFTRIMRGWQLGLGLGVELTLGALELAFTDVDGDRQIRPGFSVYTPCGTYMLRHVLALRPYDTLFLLSSRQTVTSIASALMWLISLLFQNQAFNRARTLGIHFARIIFRSNECLTMP